jgi:hypothetical protein
MNFFENFNNNSITTSTLLNNENLNQNQVNQHQNQHQNQVNQHQNIINNKATLSVDHCKLRPLEDIKSEMCEKPVLTTKCLKPKPKFNLLLDTQPTLNTEDKVGCSLFRYESPKKIISDLNNHGFYVFKKMITDQQIINSLESFNNNKINYNKLKDNLINSILLKGVSSELKKKLINIKFRVSYSQGSSNFKRNLQIKTGQERVPIYTILTFLDGGNIELIPNTNRNQSINIFNLKKNYDKIKKINLEAGDVIIFESAIINRILLDSKKTYIQLFDTVLEEDLDFYLKRILHVPCLEDCDLSQQLNNTFLRNLVDKFVYFNSSLGYSKVPLHFITDHDDIGYISQDFNKPRLEIINNEYQELNNYILNFESKDLNETERDVYMFLSFTLNNILLVLLLVIILVIIYLCIRIIFKEKNELK